MVPDSDQKGEYAENNHMRNQPAAMQRLRSDVALHADINPPRDQRYDQSRRKLGRLHVIEEVRMRYEG